MNVTFKRIKQKYGTDPLAVMLGKIHVATIHWNSSSSPDGRDQYFLTMLLPSLKEPVRRVATENQGRSLARHVIISWLEGAGV